MSGEDVSGVSTSLALLHVHVSMYMITRCACVRTCTSVAGSPEARCGVPIDLNVTKRGHTVVVLSYHKIGGGATITRP